MAFTHLHVHSEYSLLDGLARVGDLVRYARESGFEAMALTDHGVMYGAVQFYRQATKVGLKPIIGCELYVASRSRFDRAAEDRRSHHLTALAQDERGYRNLVELVSRAQLEGFYYRPRVDRDLLASHAEGLIVLSGCPSAEAPRHVLADRPDKALATLAWYKEVFGDRFFVELQQHDLEFIPKLNRAMVSMARTLDLPLVATNDVHFARREDVAAHEVLLCVQTGTTMNDPKRLRYGTSFYLRPAEEMARLFHELPEAITNTEAIAERCNLKLEFGATKLPRFDVPDGDTATSYLRRLCDVGLAERYDAVTDEIRARLDFELSVIRQMGFDDYFLVVWDLCRYAREQGIWWNVRGSGAGSIVAYSLQITSIDPLAHGLIFERFLNPARISMPDIDLDFPDDQRDDLIRYAFHRYGHDRVAQIITFGTLGARAAIKDTGRALDLPLTRVNQVAQLVPAIQGKPCSIADALRPPGTTEDTANEFYSADLDALYHDDDDVRRLVDTARSLEGVARHASTHAAGVVIADRPLTEYVPLHRPTRSGGEDAGAPPVTQYNMKDIESLGLLKVDFLGLSTLTILRKAAELVHEHHGVRLALDTIPLDDPAIYELLCAGDVVGVFQVESAGMRRLLRDMQPSRFDHVVAAIALYRPGPMEKIPEYLARMHGREPVTYRHPALQPILAETYGVCVYQEQIIRIARDLAGYDAGEADTIRKAVGKKNKPELLRHRQTFVDGAVDRGIDRQTAGALFDDIEEFARYGFNKAHSADYAVIVCQTAYFKAHYPVEYATALLSVDRDDTERIALIAADCRHLGIAVLGPDVNQSGFDFTIEVLDDGTRRVSAEATHARGIRIGLTAIKNVGEGPVLTILDARGDTPFSGLMDFCQRVDLRQVGRRALESLVAAGALDAFGERGSLLASVDRMLGHSASQFQAAEVGQLTLFGDGPSSPGSSLLFPLPESTVSPKELLAAEKELLGLYVSDHPLQRMAAAVADTVTTLIGGIDLSLVGQAVTVAGLVASVRQVTTRKGEVMAFAQIEDLQGSIEVTLFPRVYAACRDVWQADNLVVVHGRVDERNERVQLLAESADLFEPRSPDDLPSLAHESARAADDRARGAGDRAPAPAPEAPTAAPSSPSPSYQLLVNLSRSGDHEADIQTMARVYETLTSYSGTDRFYLYLPNGPDTVELAFPNSSTRYCVGLVNALESILGQGRIEVRPVAHEREAARSGGGAARG